MGALGVVELQVAIQVLLELLHRIVEFLPERLAEELIEQRSVEALDEAVRLRPGLRVLFTSGYTENAIVHHGRLDRGVHLINKPYRRRDLARKLRIVLDELNP